MLWVEEEEEKKKEGERESRRQNIPASGFPNSSKDGVKVLSKMAHSLAHTHTRTHAHTHTRTHAHTHTRTHVGPNVFDHDTFRSAPSQSRLETLNPKP